ncbi:MAG: dihydrofolate reductase [Pseudomonadota bacterium]
MKQPRVVMVVAVASNGVIGADGDLAWKISDDLKWFKSVTMNKPIIMGRKTFDSIGRALPGRENIVLTRAPEFSAQGVFIARAPEPALRLGRAIAAAADVEEVCIIGGAEIYAGLLARTERIYLTRVAASVEGDAVFPALDSADWTERHVSSCKKSPKNDHDCEFFILDRKPTITSKDG